MVQVLCPQIQKLISALRSKEACVAVSERIPSGDLTYLLKMAIEIYWNYPLKTVIFHSHVNVYQRISNEGSAISILPQAWRLTGVAEAAAAVSDCIIEPSRLCSTGTTGPSPRKIHPSQSEMGLAWLSVMSAPQNSHICWGFFMVFLPCTLKTKSICTLGSDAPRGESFPQNTWHLPGISVCVWWWLATGTMWGPRWIAFSWWT